MNKNFFDIDSRRKYIKDNYIFKKENMQDLIIKELNISNLLNIIFQDNCIFNLI